MATVAWGWPVWMPGSRRDFDSRKWATRHTSMGVFLGAFAKATATDMAWVSMLSSRVEHH